MPVFITEPAAGGNRSTVLAIAVSITIPVIVTAGIAAVVIVAAYAVVYRKRNGSHDFPRSETNDDLIKEDPRDEAHELDKQPRNKKEPKNIPGESNKLYDMILKQASN